MPELGPYGSVRGALSNERPYRDLANPSASYLIGIAWQLRLRSAQLRRRRPFACKLRDKDLQLRRSGRFQHEVNTTPRHQEKAPTRG
jgi:hypothetical protein